MNNHRLHQLDDYLDGSLSASERAEVDLHLQGCESCRSELARLELLVRRARELPRSLRPRRDLWSGIEEKITENRAWQKNKPVLWARTGLTRFIRTGAALAAVIAIAVLGSWWLFLRVEDGWNLAVLQGTATVGSAMITGESRMTVGEILKTGNEGKARIEVGAIGHVEVEPNSTVRLLRATTTDHRLALDRGTLTAAIVAPPRLFFVETPSALAVDLGCAYTLQVNDSGMGFLHVTSGWVALEYDRRESIVPAGAMCMSRPGVGPGTPYQEDASPELIGALAQFDFENGGADALQSVLSESRNMDSITLWHLFLRTQDAQKAAVYDRLAFLVPPPKEVTRDGMLAGDPEMIQRWRKHLNLGMDAWWKNL